MRRIIQIIEIKNKFLVLKLADLKQIYQRLVVKATIMLISTLKETAKGGTTLTMTQLLTDFQKNFRSRIVVLFTSTFLLSCDPGFLNGQIFNNAINIRTADDWERYKDYLTSNLFALRHNMNPELIKKKTEAYLDAAATEWPTVSEKILELKKYFGEKFDSTAVLAQATDQVAKLCWMLHKCPSKIAHLFRYVLADPQVRRRLEKFNTKLDKNHLRRIAAEEAESQYVLRKVYFFTFPIAKRTFRIK